MDLREIGLGGCGLDSTVSGQGPMAGCCECGDEPSGSCATELVSYRHHFCSVVEISKSAEVLVCLHNRYLAQVTAVNGI
jgi:hypothetical protein